MKPLPEPWSLVVRTAYYLAILLGVLAVAAQRMGIRPSFVYQGF